MNIRNFINKCVPLISLILILTAVIPSKAYSPAASSALGTTMTWSSTGRLQEGQTTYNLRDDTADTYELKYSTTSDVEDIVLVISCLDYGQAFKTLIQPATNANIADAFWNEQHTMMALKLKPMGAGTSLTIQLETVTIPLTQKQCENWMDNGVLSATGLTIREYRHSGPASTARDSGELLDTCTFGSMTPAVYNSNPITNIYWYNVGVSSQLELANLMLGDKKNSYGGEYNFGRNTKWGEQKDPYLYYEIKTIHNGETPLVEIKKFKVYVPGNNENLTLTRVQNIGAQTSFYNSNLNLASFTEGFRFGNWNVSSRREDSQGAYYIIEPPAGTRIFNNRESSITDSVKAGMKLVWAVNENLPSSSTSETLLQAADTEVIYQAPSGTNRPDTKSYNHTGPQLHVWKRVMNDSILHGYNSNQRKQHLTIDERKKTVGAEYTEKFTHTTNSYYEIRSADGIHTEYFPTYDGKVVQTYEFHFEIQPKCILIGNYHGTPYGDIWIENTELADVSYTLLDGNSFHFTENDISKINATIKSSFTESGKRESINFENFSDSNPVTKVVITWNHLHCALQRSNSITPGQHSDSLANSYIQFTYRVSPVHEDGSPVQDNELVQVLYECKTDDSSSVTHTPTGMESMKAGDEYIWFKLKKPYDVIFYGADTRVHGSIYGAKARPQMMDGEENKAILMQEMGFRVDLRGERQDILINPEIRLRIEEEGTNLTNSVGENGPMTDQERLIFFSGRFTVSESAK